MVEGPEDQTHHLLRIDTPAMDEMDARMEADGIPRLLVTTGVDGDLPHPITPVPAGVPLDLAMPEEEDGVPLRPEAVGVSPD